MLAQVARALARENRDVEKLTKRINIAKDQLPTWPNDRLHVLAEHSSLFYDLFSDPKVPGRMFCACHLPGSNLDCIR